MLFRAIFWIAVVALLMPHGKSQTNCESAARCSHALELLDHIRASGMHRLEQVRGEIESAEQARAQQG
ncbi:MAG TPA: hypothetical protein VHU18_13230 [Rhizomicrobium sp.]|jgi:hypothetical protein|nr:hypothetical protein [Rhizomicrobium sp.]